jgi:hypothetical protein
MLGQQTQKLDARVAGTTNNAYLEHMITLGEKRLKKEKVAGLSASPAIRANEAGCRNVLQGFGRLVKFVRPYR